MGVVIAAVAPLVMKHPPPEPGKGACKHKQAGVKDARLIRVTEPAVLKTSHTCEERGHE
jgi:hypothetical protein